MTDYIDRQAAIEAVGRNSWAGSRLERMPSVEVEPVKTGKWTRKESKRMYWYVCSECGGGCPCNGYGQDMFTEWCPNCGARMSEGSEE